MDISKASLPPSKIHKYSASITKRRKSLFQSQEEAPRNLSDAIQPLESFSDEESSGLKCTSEDYVILGTIECRKSIMNEEFVANTPQNSRKICCALSPERQLISATITSPSNAVVCESYMKQSPTEKLKTPNEASSNKVKIPKLIRKSLLDSSFNDMGKRISISSPVENGSLEGSATKVSKVRTALFPEEEMVLPVSSFYPKSDSTRLERSFHNNEANLKKKKALPPVMFLCNRRMKAKKNSGQINAGVRHKIRKPKKKKMQRASILKAAINILEHSPLNLEQVGKITNVSANISQNQKMKMDSILKNLEGSKKDSYTVNMGATRKRAHSPIPDSNRKFFKSSRSKIITIHSDMRFNVQQGDDKFKEPNLSPKLDASDLSIPDDFDDALPMDNILEALEDKENSPKEMQLPQDGNILSPTSQMCDLTLGLAIRSPKKAKLNITSILEECTNGRPMHNIFKKVFPSADMERQKLYPIFYRGPKTQHEAKEAPKSVASNNKKWKSLHKDQMLLDAGQKRFGATQCPECKIIYHMGDPGDELMHFNYHHAGHILRFNGWKHENVVGSSNGGKIVKISQGDPKVWWKKVNDLMEVVNRDLGFYELQMAMEHTQVYLYIKNKQIRGCVVAQPKTIGHKMLTGSSGVDLCSEESYPIKCGILRIWVNQGNRREGIGTALINSVRSNFMFGHILDHQEIAFSSPTEQGKIFASNYFKTCNFLVYT